MDGGVDPGSGTWCLDLVSASAGMIFPTPPVAPPGPSRIPAARASSPSRQTTLRSFMVSDAFVALGTGVFRPQEGSRPRVPGGSPGGPRPGTWPSAPSRRARIFFPPPVARARHAARLAFLLSPRARKPQLREEEPILNHVSISPGRGALELGRSPAPAPPPPARHLCVFFPASFREFPCPPCRTLSAEEKKERKWK